MDLPTLILAVIAVIEGFVGVLQLIQMIGSRVALVKLNRFTDGLQDPENRVKLFSEISHGVMKAIGERQGALKGAASRQAEGALGADVSGLAISGLASFLPKKYQAFAPLIAPYVQQFLEKMPQNPLLPGSSAAGSGQGSGQPP